MVFNVSERITELREKKGITVNKLANLAGLSQGFVRQIELGEKNPTVESLGFICDALGITFSEFFTIENELSLEQTQLLNLSKDLNRPQLLTLNEFLKTLNP